MKGNRTKEINVSVIEQIIESLETGKAHSAELIDMCHREDGYSLEMDEARAELETMRIQIKYLRAWSEK